MVPILRTVSSRLQCAGRRFLQTTIFRLISASPANVLRPISSSRLPKTIAIAPYPVGPFTGSSAWELFSQWYLIAAALSPLAQSGHARWREGTGLGLPIAQALVQLHGGALQIESSKAYGTEVKVILPSRPPALSAERRDRGAAGRAGAR